MDPYRVLGVRRTDSDDEIKKAYRNLSRKFHPDANINNPNRAVFEEKFKQVQVAYDLIMKERRGESPYGQSRGPGSSYGQGGYTGQGGFNGQGGYTGQGPFGQGSPFGSQWGDGSTYEERYRQRMDQYGRENPYSSGAPGWCFDLIMFNMLCRCCC